MSGFPWSVGQRRGVGAARGRARSTRLAACAAAAACLALLAVAPATHAAFPGANGLIAAESPAGGSEPLTLVGANGAVAGTLAPGARDPAFSPRGRRIAFARDGDIWVMDVDGSRARAVTSGPTRDAQPAWSPGGEALVFAGGPAGSRDVYRVRADGSGRQRLTFRSVDDAEPTWSSTDRIAFVRRPRGRATPGVVHVLTPASWTIQRITPARESDASPAWSPDGRRLAVARGRPGRRSLVVVGADGRGARVLVGPEQDPAAPVWSPDGQRVLFTARAEGGRRLLSVSAAGGPAQVIGAAARGPRAVDWQPGGLDPMIAAAGDVACDPLDPTFNAGRGNVDRCHMRQTSDLLLGMDLDAVLVLGDLQNNDGRLVAFQTAFGPSWGRLGSLLRPVPGNHEYETFGAAGYFDFFNGPGVVSGPAGERGEGWYSFDVGAWHIVALNSQCGPAHERSEGTDCASGSRQEQWLRADLAAHPNACTLAFFHHPRFASGIPGRDDVVLPLWQTLYDGGVDLILNGHDHAYERFAPLDASGTPDPERGVRQFVVGTGGHSHQRSLYPEAHSELRDARDFGILRLTLRPTAYDWAFVTDGGAAVDLGSGPCH